MIKLATKSPDDTRELGAVLASQVRRGDVILLSGDLGAGKTTLTQGLGRALGVDQTITSPTFTIIRSYPGHRLELHHVDLYRMDRVQEVVDLALPELVDDKGVALIEWGDLARPVLGQDLLEARFEFGEGDDDRVLNLTPVGGAWTKRVPALRAALDRWAT